MSDVFAWPPVLGPLLRREDLSQEQAGAAMGSVLAGEATPAQIAAFATGLRIKGETAAEMTGLVKAMLAAAAPLEVPGPLLDTCGTGGDRAGTFNVSTLAALVAVGAGQRVAKHGNRAASGRCGSADLLEALGVAIALPPEGVAATLAEVRIGFCFAPVFHPAMRHAGVPRRELGVPTVFNFLGPLANPARAHRARASTDQAASSAWPASRARRKAASRLASAASRSPASKKSRAPRTDSQPAAASSRRCWASVGRRSSSRPT